MMTAPIIGYFKCGNEQIESFYSSYEGYPQSLKSCYHDEFLEALHGSSWKQKICGIPPASKWLLAQTFISTKFGIKGSLLTCRGLSLPADGKTRRQTSDMAV